MYSLARRLKLSLIVPVVLTLVYILKIVQINQNLENVTTSPIIRNIYFILDVCIVYILSVVFFSIETLISAYITNTDTAESQAIKSELAQASLFQKIKVLEKWDKASESRKITRSVVFQLALIIFAAYAVTSSGTIVGLGVTLGILLQMIVDQILLLRGNQDASIWFWQIKTNIVRQFQVLYVAAAAVVFLILAGFIFR